MTKFHIKSGILIVPMLLIALAGCKKSDSTPTFTVDSSTLHFLFGQEKEVGFTIQNIGSVEVTDSPTGWDCQIVGNNIVITAPASTALGALGGTVHVAAKGSSTITRSISVAIKIPEEITSHANCFIVAKPNTRYKFDATKKGNQSTGSLSPDDALLVWSTSKGAVNHVSLEDDYIYFATAAETTLTEANALIAVVDKDDKILWSWHIWITDYDPSANTHTLDGKQVMDRNLGAFASSNASPEDVLRSYGLYYQWGRKDPFIGPKAWNSTGPSAMYNANSKWFTITFETTTSTIGTVEYATANPTNFIVGADDSNYDWLFAARNNDLWGGISGNKTIYDPCPAGWKVAPPSIWASFTTTGQVSDDPLEFVVDGAYKYGWTFYDDNSELVYYPAAGRRSFTMATNNFTNIVNKGLGEPGSPVGFYWSNSNISANESALLAFTDDYINPGTAYNITPRSRADDEDPSRSAEGARAGGFPLRCVAE